jgi:D-glycero-alpha-D-manno-heptose-7-phosphate kinase
MIITRSPLRITLGGGGTDVPSYYREHGGFCVAAAINKYVYITLHQTFEPGITLKYSKVERVKSVDEIEHPIFREALKMMNMTDPHLEIASHADIPAGTGLGSSSAFTTALIKALYAYQGMDAPAHTIAQAACEVEIIRLNGNIGKQDQFMAAFGGINSLTFCADGTTEVEKLRLSTGTQNDLESNLLLFFTGFTRQADDVIKTQTVDNLDKIRNAGHAMRDTILTGDMYKFSEALDLQWRLKLERNPNFDPRIIEWYTLGKKHAGGGKLVGAGGGGFLMFHSKYGKENLRAAMHKAGLKEVRFMFDHEGTKVVCQ